MHKSKSLSVIDGEKLLALEIEPPRFIVEKLIPTGLHLLAGSPKIGKSWLSLWLCNQVSRGEKVWEFDTATSADNLSDGLIVQLESFVRSYPDTGLIVVDTLQRIRDEERESTYANDYREIRKIKGLADEFNIAMLLVHHLRKAPDSDPFNMVSGSTGIIGAVDTIFVLEKQKRVDNAAVLHVTGRDVEDMQIKLEFEKDPPVWKFTGYGDGRVVGGDQIIKVLTAFMSRYVQNGRVFRDGERIDSGFG